MSFITPPANRLPDRTHRKDRTAEPFPDHHNDLSATLKFAWQMIARGVQDRRSAFHTPVFATLSTDGPQARVLVLRACELTNRTLIFYTDRRSAKVLELGGDPRSPVSD